MAMAEDPSMQMDEQNMQSEMGQEGPIYNDSIKKNLESHLDALGPEQQEFIAAHLTPEIAGMFGLVLGQEAYDFMSQYANPEVVLVPMPRSALQQGKQAAQADPNVPMQEGPPQTAQPQQPQPQAAPAGLMQQL